MIRIKRALLAKADDSREGQIRALKNMLQTAIELEHSTIPPYLYALYSIKTGTNLEVARLIRSIVLQEMLHMAIDCNVLNAIGGSPKIDDPQFIPHYPGPLPGTVDEGLIVPLAPLSKQLISDVFMSIEEPENPIDQSQAPGSDSLTIGEFYQHIQEKIIALSKEGNLFTGNPKKQLLTGFPELQNQGITDAQSAVDALELIVKQGEGTTTSPLDPEHELAHFYKYAEIYHGRKLIANPEPRFAKDKAWVYKGHRIEFDPSGVQPVIANPNPDTYKDHPRLLSLNLAFNAAYSDLLRKLHQVFNGRPDWLGPALLSMQNLKDQAQLMMSLEIVPGQTAGPTFEYISA
jgi:hypothetical protein